MRPFILYFAVALMTFGISVFVVFTYRGTPEEKPITKEETIEIQPKNNGVTGYGTGRGSGRVNEADYVPKLHKATCSDKKLLPLWNELKKDKEFKEHENYFYQDAADCTNAVEIQRTDLNEDGEKEFIVWGRYNFCGGTGNCALWIYEKKNGKYKQLLQSGAYYGESKWFEAKKAKTNGYRNLLLKGHFTAAETTYHFYKFIGSKYVENKCFFEIYSMNEETPSFMTCKAYHEKTEREIRETKNY